MPTPLYNVLNFRPAPAPQMVPDATDSFTNGLITDADVQDAQDADLNKQIAFNEQLGRDPITNERRGVVNLRSADATRQQLMGGLRRTLGMEQAKAETEAAKATHEAQLQSLLMGQQQKSAERIAQINAQAKANSEAERFAFQAAENAKKQEHATRLAGQSNQRAIQNSQRVQEGENRRQALGQAEGQARALEAQAAKMSPFASLLGTKQALLQQAADIRKAALAKGQQISPSDIAAAYAAQYPGVQGQELQSILQQSQPNASAEDIQALYDEILRNQ